MNRKLMEVLCRKEQSELKDMMITYLTNVYDKENVLIADGYILCKGCIDIALIAHMDKVFTAPMTEFYYDEEKGVMWSPQGAGFDDRAGIYAIIQILKKGYRPHIILTEDEEIGAVGAKKLLMDFPESPFDSLAYMIELDRAGHNDCVFYNCCNDDFTKYIENFGFEFARGTFTDIRVLSPAWGVAAVNLSIGYYDEHIEIERLNIKSMERTISKVEVMLNDENHLSYAFVKGKNLCEFCLEPIGEVTYLFNSYRICKNCNDIITYRSDCKSKRVGKKPSPV